MQTTPTLPPMSPMPPMRPPVQEPSEPSAPDPEQQRRAHAIKRMRDRNALLLHLVAYVVITACCVVLWAITGIGYFWPIFVMLGWGAGVAVHGYCVYSGNDTSAFLLHLVVYLVINAGFVAAWALTETGYFFWPIFVILAWGAGVAAHGYSVYGGDKSTEAQVERERNRRGGDAA